MSLVGPVFMFAALLGLSVAVAISLLNPKKGCGFLIATLMIIFAAGVVISVLLFVVSGDSLMSTFR